MFITDEDYKVVIGESALKVVSQVSTENRSNAEMEAQEEMAGYLRPKYDCAALFAAEGDERNRLVVMYCCDIALYHMAASLPEDGHGNTQGALRKGRQMAGGRTGREDCAGSAGRTGRGW